MKESAQIVIDVPNSNNKYELLNLNNLTNEKVVGNNINININN